jgi:serine/threonine protein kinase
MGVSGSTRNCTAQAFALDGDRIARFRREAQVLAALNHANIAAIYGFEDSGSTHALVLELVEGPTLAGRIAKGALPLDEALPIAKQIAEALESNPWDVHSIETVVAGGDGLQEVVGDKATALK